VKESRQGDSGGFALMEPSNGVKALRSENFKPDRRARYPALDQRRRDWIGKFSLNGTGKNHSFKQARKKVDMSNENQIIYRAGIRDHQPHGAL
jgi:hypothetical protein